MDDRIAQLILEKLKTPAIQKFIVLSATNSGSGGFGNTGLQSCGLLDLVKLKENGAEKIEKVQNERIIKGSKEKIAPNSHIASQ